MGASLAVKEAAEGQAGRERWPWKRSPVRLKTFHQRLHKTLAWTDSTRYLRFVLNTATAPQPLESMPRAVAEIQSAWLPLKTITTPRIRNGDGVWPLARRPGHFGERRLNLARRYVQVHRTGQMR